MDQLKEALLTLDPEDDAHWTEDGLPVVEVVADMVGNEDLTREEITEAHPTFGRKSLRELREAAEITGEPEEITEEADPESHLDAKLRDIDNEIAELAEQRVELEAAINDAARRRSAIVEAQAKARNEGTNQQAIRAAIDQSNRQRAARAEQHAKLLSNLKPGQVDPRSPYEQARAAQARANRPSQPLRTP